MFSWSIFNRNVDGMDCSRNKAFCSHLCVRGLVCGVGVGRAAAWKVLNFESANTRDYLEAHEPVMKQI